MVLSLPEGVFKSSSSSSNISNSLWFSISNILAVLPPSKSVFIPKWALLQDFDQNTASIISAHYTVRSSNHPDFIKMFMLLNMSKWSFGPQELHAVQPFLTSQ
jgi:hypothetical protein